ncbi:MULTISPECIES: hypothetical protein [Thioclava]|uniref:Cation transport ATPase n=1 Tax=Thioclava litoralis TaxID=3076557 RepID=A0ABZ1DXS1_9RHOB|nr:hypothetical protein RPE78_07350 [Thioclava sp. FTW29]
MAMSRVKLGLCVTLVASALAGCQTTMGPQATGTVIAGDTVLSAPAGYCVAGQGHPGQAENNVILFGDCAAVTNDATHASAPHPAMLSATVGPKMTGSITKRFPMIEAFFRSAAGQAAIARSGRSDDVDILKSQVSGDLLLLKVRDRSLAEEFPVTAEYWRGVTSLDGHLTALSVMALRSQPMSDAAQLRLLKEFVGRSEAATKAHAASAGQAKPAQ